MSKRQQHIASEVKRGREEKESMSAADLMRRGAAKGNADDHRQEPGAGKNENDHNKQGAKAATQVNEAQRTPESRHDRENLAGSHNQVAARKGTGSRGAG